MGQYLEMCHQGHPCVDVQVASHILMVNTICGITREKRNPWQFRVDTLATCIPYRAASRKHGTVNV